MIFPTSNTTSNNFVQLAPPTLFASAQQSPSGDCCRGPYGATSSVPMPHAPAKEPRQALQQGGEAKGVWEAPSLEPMTYPRKFQLAPNGARLARGASRVPSKRVRRSASGSTSFAFVSGIGGGEEVPRTETVGDVDGDCRRYMSPPLSNI